MFRYTVVYASVNCGKKNSGKILIMIRKIRRVNWRAVFANIGRIACRYKGFCSKARLLAGKSSAVTVL